MATELRRLTHEALAMPERDRLVLASELINSVEGPEGDDWSIAWSAELNRRVTEADETGDRGRPWDEVRAEFLARLARR